MVKINPQIILRADLVTPNRVPAAIESVFDRLGNYLLPKMGVQVAFEFFDTGWLSFFGTLSNFRAFFGRPAFSKSQKASSVTHDKGDAPLIWEYKFERTPSNVSEENLGKILQRYYSVPGSLGEGSLEKVLGTDGTKRYRIVHPSLVSYISNAKEVVKQAHALYLSLRKNP